MSDNPSHGEKEPSLSEFTPIGSKSGGILESTTPSFANPSPILQFSERNDKTKTRNHRYFSGTGQNPSRKLTSSGYSLHRTNNATANLSKDTQYNDDILQSSSAASSVWEEDLNNDHNQHVGAMKLSGLFGRDGIQRGTNVIPDFVPSESNPASSDINVDANMLRLQSDTVQKLKTENTNLRVEVLTLRRNLNGLPVDSVELINQNVELNQQVIKLRELLALNATNPSIDDKNDRESQMQSEIDDLKDQLNQHKRQLGEVHDNYQNTLSEKERLLHDNYEKDSDIKKLQDECKRYEDEIFQLTVNLRDNEKSQKSEEQLNEISKLESQIDHLEDRKFNLENENNKLSQEYHDLEIENEKLKSTIDRFEDNSEEKLSSELLNEIAQYKEKIKEIEASNDDLKKKYEKDIRINYHSSRDKIFEMTNRLEEATKTIDSLDKELETKEANEALLTKNIKELNLKIETYQEKNELLESKLEKIKSTKSESANLISEEIDELYSKVADYQSEIGKLKDHIKDLENGKSVNTGLLDDNEEYINDLEHETDELYISLLDAKKEIKNKNDEINNLKLKLSTITEAENQKEDDNGDISVDQIIELKRKFEEERNSHEAELSSIINDSRDMNEKLIGKIEELESSKSKLIEDLEDLQYEYKDLERKYSELTNSDDIENLSRDFATISLEFKKSQEENMLLTESYNNEIELLTKQLRLKDIEINRINSELESKGEININTESLNEKLTMLEESVMELRKKKENLEREKSELEDSRLKLNIENVELRKNIEKNKVLLESFETEQKNLNARLQKKNSSISQLERRIDTLTSENIQLKEVINKLKNDEEEILIKSNKVSEKIEKNDKSMNNTIKEYESKLNEKTRQYNDIVAEYNYMKNDLIQRLKEMKTYLKNQDTSRAKDVEDWKERYEKVAHKLKASEKNLEVLKKEVQMLNEDLELERDRERNNNIWYPETPESPSQREESSMGKLSTLKSQKELLLMKLKEKNEKISDLKYMLKYLRLEIEKRDEMFDRNKALFSNVGLVVDNASDKKRNIKQELLKRFRVGIITVISVNRFHKRSEEIKRRACQYKILKQEIENRRGI